MLYKLTFIITLILSSLIVIKAQPQYLTLEAAWTQAQENNKSVLLVFSGSDWCKPCIRLKKEILDTEPFKYYASEQLVIYIIDFPYSKKNSLAKDHARYNDELAERINPEGHFPGLFLMTDAGEQPRMLPYSSGMNADDLIHAIHELKRQQ